MATYYNEHDPKAAAWLRELIRAGLIPAGDVDERDIQTVSPHDLTGYTQQHFFAGIGGWAFALRLAGWDDDRPVRTGSCPCQPFSAAGLGLGEADARHLWPVFRDLITFGEHTITFGEQVASAPGRIWLARIRADLEGLGYGVGAADLCSAGVGSPNIRQRLFWLAHAYGKRLEERQELNGNTQRPEQQTSRRNDARGCGGIDGLEHATSDRRQQRRSESSGRGIASGRRPCGLAYADGGKSGHGDLQPSGQYGQQPQDGGARRMGNPSSARGGWNSGAVSCPERKGQRERIVDGCLADQPFDAGAVGGLGHANEQGPQGRDERGHGADQWTPWTASVVLPCTDGKARRIEPGSFPLADGVSGRVGLLRGYGNAINPWIAAEFILACEEALN